MYKTRLLRAIVFDKSIY